ncbi:hypothetical protein TIFTF001_034046 [Ficus carica]|uniref:Uncharacterized protein n=1 Tax=Ficus carica TaxID=3494 RepID=A0AA88J7Y6_FICCA|nr:hypothetical protein TIFTF001_034046 [Ficus carica]
MNGGVAVGGDWKREIEGEWRERMKGGVMEEEMGFQGEIGGENERSVNEKGSGGGPICNDPTT